MVKGPADAITLAVIVLAMFCPVFILAGYAILIHEAWGSPTNRQERLKRVWNWKEHQHEVNRRGLQLIAIGAGIGVLVFSIAGIALVGVLTGIIRP